MKSRALLQIILSALLFGIFWSSQGCAVQLDNLYTVVIQVTDNTLETRNKHLPQAFEQIMLKTSASADVLNHPEYISARQHLDRFINTYFYTESDNGYNLTLRFSEPLVNNLLKKMGRASLGKNRPQILLWLVLEENNKPNFVTHGPYEEVATKVDNLATAYGMPIILPLLDLTERLFISEQDVINFNAKPLQLAAGRYNTDTMVIGKLNHVGDVWHCEWRLIEHENNVSWNSSSTNLNEELELMMNNLGEKLLTHHAQWNAPKLAKHGVTLRVKGINNVADYARVLGYLKTLAVVQQVEIGSVDGSQATFMLTADGGKDAVDNALQFDKLLVSETDLKATTTQTSNNIELIYKVGS